MILFHQMTEFMITWIMMWNKRSRLKKVLKFLTYDLRHFQAKRRLKICRGRVAKKAGAKVES